MKALVMVPALGTNSLVQCAAGQTVQMQERKDLNKTQDESDARPVGAVREGKGARLVGTVQLWPSGTYDPFLKHTVHFTPKPRHHTHLYRKFKV